MTKKKRLKQKNKIIVISTLCIIFIILALINTIYTPKKVIFTSRVENEKKYNLTYQDEKFDTVGWIQVQGTNIDYPIIYHEGGDSSYPVEVSSYAWLSNYEVGFHNHMRVTGHNIFNLSKQPELHSKLFERFEELMGFVYYDFSEKNQYIQLTFDGKDYIYKIFAVDFFPSVERLEFPLEDNYTEKDMKNFISTVKKYSIYDYDVDVNENDKVITLLTCTRFFGDANYDFRVVGRLLREGEEMDRYSVKMNKNYERVKELLEGDEKDENL